MDREQCGNCRFWRAKDQVDPEDPWGHCHRHAGLPVLPLGRGASIGDLVCHWPATEEEDWCGEYQPLPLARKREGG